MKNGKEYRIEEYTIDEEPFYLESGEEKKIFKAAHKHKIPFAAIGPTGCGKTRFIEHMSYLLNEDAKDKKPLFFVTCHEDLTSDDLLGRERISGDYLPGILQRWAKEGGILYLDEIVEARPDLVTLLHPVMEPKRRVFYNEKTGNVTELNPECMLSMSWNPGYQDITRRLKPSSRQRLITHRFNYPEPAQEAKIIMEESGVDAKNAKALADLGVRIRGMKEGDFRTLQEGASTRTLIDAGILIKEGISPRDACQDAVVNCLTEDTDDVYKELSQALDEVVENFFPRG
ncbi:AAA family ATPase [Candidatus Pacearchaeota archaeon]|nr:AAA family ATPase [Candidatus Pacearchaeota archaeon]|tara:strand:+ start:3902 stop:4762 length:861 start_codon:yes stop_codon:yes gene_type:complete